ncbi:hypothetical protein Bca4012_011636 [Brassica carinata]
MSSEIEVVEEVQSNRKENGESSSKPIEDESLKNDVYTAAAYGDLEKLHRLVECEGCSVSEPDGLGYYALQWSALNNRTAVAQYIIEHGGDVHAADHTGQTALHWSAVRGATKVAELLLQEGARVDATDMYGYQGGISGSVTSIACLSYCGCIFIVGWMCSEPTHVAAQYGQTAFLCHVVSKWNADPDVPDNDGRSPLHWAAYKGCTPLHWAAIRGNLEACTVLVQAGKKEDLVITDNTGLTPAQLAADKNHRQVSFFLVVAATASNILVVESFYCLMFGNARRLLETRCDGNTPLGKLSKLGLAPVLWFMILLLLLIYTNSVILASNLPKLTTGIGSLAWLGFILATAGLVLFYRCSKKDPGYIRMNIHDPQTMKDDVSTINFIGTTVENRAKQPCFACWELVAALCNMQAMLITGGVTLARVLSDPSAPSSFGAWISHVASNHVGALSFLIVEFCLFFSVAVLTVIQGSQISRNITTNEMANALRYSYLRGPGGRFRNPYDLGCRRNCSDFLLKGYNEDIECHEEDTTPRQDGISMMQMQRSSNIQNGNGHVAIDVNPIHNSQSAHVHSSKCSHSHSSKPKSDGVPLGLGLGLGRNTTRPVVPP